MRRLRARDATDSPAPRTQRRKWKAQAPLTAVGRIDAFELARERGPLHQAVWSTRAALVVVPCGLHDRLRYVTQRRSNGLRSLARYFCFPHNLAPLQAL